MGSESAKAATQKAAKGDERSRRTADAATRRALPALPFLGLQRALGNRSATQLLAPPPLAEGQPLPDATRELFAPALGELFESVRIHRGADSAAAADATDAEAFTYGIDIVFGPGRFAPSTDAGRRLLAHEIAHVLQQTAHGLPPATAAQAETDADAFASDVLAGRSARVAYATPRRLARQPKPPTAAARKPPARGTFEVSIANGQYVYTYNIEDAKAWPNEKISSFTNYVMDAFPGTNEAIATAYLSHNGISIHGDDLTAIDPKVQIINYTIESSLHSDVTDWMAQNHPEITPKPIVSGARSLPRAPGPQAPAGTGTGAPPAGGGAPKPGGTPKPGTDPQPGGSDKKRGDGTNGPDGNPYGQAGGSPNGIVKYEPIGSLRITPDIKAYVANSRCIARVMFDTGNPYRGVLNIFPNHASFAWTIYKDGKKYDTNLIELGRIEYEVDFLGPGSYTIAVEVSSDEFIDDKKLNLVSPPLQVVAENVRDAQLFESNLVGADRSKPFERDANGQLKAKAGFVPLSISSEIDGLNAEIAAIAELRKEQKLSDADAQTYTTFFNEQLAGLKKIQQHVGSQPYIIGGTFISREDSAGFTLRAFMNRTGRGVTDANHAFVDVELYDSTLSPGEPRRARGHGESTMPADDPRAYASAELNAISEMAGDWRQYNEFPDGTLHFAVTTLEGAGDVREWTFDTHTSRKTARSVLGGVAAVGGVALLVASPFTGGLTAPVGVILLGAVEGVVAGLTIALVADSINERIKTNTFHFDARFVMDMATLVTVFVGAAGAMRALPAAAGTARNGMLIFNFGAGAINFAMMTVATRGEIDAENATYFASIASVTDPATKADMEEKHRARLAAIMGRACVSGGIILVATGVAARAAFEPEPEVVPPNQRPPSQPPLEQPQVPPGRPALTAARPAAASNAANVPNVPAAPENVTVPKAAPPSVTPPNVPPPATPAATGGGGNAGPEEIVSLYHGTRQAGYEGVSEGIDVGHSPGAHQDYGPGFYTSEDQAVAEQAAGMRPEKGGTGRRYVLRWDIPKSKLGKIVDVRPGGKERALWEAFLKEPPSFAKRLGFPSRPGFRTNEEYLSGLGIEQRGTVFEEFLAANNLSDADTVFGEIGTPTTSGAAALPDRVSTQVVVRSQKVADELNAITRGPAPGNLPPAGGSTPPPPPPPPSSPPAAPGGPPTPPPAGVTALGPLVRTPVQASGAPATVLEIGAGAKPTNLGVPPDPALVSVTSTDVKPVRPGVTALDANQPIPAQLRGQFDTVVVNNPYGYDPDVAKLGDALKPNGRIIIQGRSPANNNFKTIFENAQKGQAPPGYRVASVQSWNDPAATAPPTPQSPAPQSPAVLGGPFNKTSGDALAKPVNARVIFEKLPTPQFRAIPAGQTPQTLGSAIGAKVVADVQAARGTGGPSWANRVLDSVRPLGLSPADSAATIESATRAAGYSHGLRATLPDGTLVVTSARVGDNNFIVGIRTDGTIVRGTATIEMGAGVPSGVRVSNITWQP